jgi:hypothetical protein
MPKLLVKKSSHQKVFTRSKTSLSSHSNQIWLADTKPKSQKACSPTRPKSPVWPSHLITIWPKSWLPNSQQEASVGSLGRLSRSTYYPQPHLPASKVRYRGPAVIVSFHSLLPTKGKSTGQPIDYQRYSWLHQNDYHQGEGHQGVSQFAM